MKINKLMFAVLAGAIMASCSDDVINDVKPEPTPTPAASTLYIGVSIGMPSESVTRGKNDNFDDGLASEYGVTGAAILFFTGPEANPDFYKAYTITENDWTSVNDNPNQITQNNVATFPVDFVKQSSGNLWALAVINPGSIVQVQADNSVKINGSEFTGSFNDFQALTTSAALYGDRQFFMTNAPWSTVPGTVAKNGSLSGTPKFHVLAAVNQDNLFPTLEEAKEKPAAEIFVERAVAKVEVNSSTLAINPSLKFPEDEDQDFGISEVTWVLDNLEPTSFLIRNVDENHVYDAAPSWATYNTNSTQGSLTNHYRFMGNTPFRTGMSRYRTYFGVDPHGVGINENDKLSSALSNQFGETGTAHPQYCKENTFDVEHMDYRNTTRAVIKVNFGGNGFVYTVGEDKKNVYYFADAASYLAQAVLYDERVVAAWTKHFENLGKAYANNATINDLVYTRSDRTAENNWMKITMRTNTTKGRLEVVSVALKDGEGNAVTFNESDATAAEVNKNVTVKCYENGVAYYSVLIRHFGNDLAPWTAVDETTNTTVDSYGKNNGAGGLITPQDIQNYLGRYGVLRNNWYVVNLGTINQMGEPVLGDLPLDGTPDDKVTKEESITCRINILSWNKREQNNNL